MSTNLPPEVVEALRRGDAIGAIKLLRQKYPKMGLKEAKAMLEAIQRLAAAHPKPPVASATKSAAAHASNPMHPPKGSSTPMVYRRSGLSPGEMPRTGEGGGFAVVLIVAALAALAWLQLG